MAVSDACFRTLLTARQTTWSLAAGKEWLHGAQALKHRRVKAWYNNES